jgi:hypothetical protein
MKEIDGNFARSDFCAATFVIPGRFGIRDRHSKYPN